MLTCECLAWQDCEEDNANLAGLGTLLYLTELTSSSYLSAHGLFRFNSYVEYAGRMGEYHDYSSSDEGEVRLPMLNITPALSWAVQVGCMSDSV